MKLSLFITCKIFLKSKLKNNQKIYVFLSWTNFLEGLAWKIHGQDCGVHNMWRFNVILDFSTGFTVKQNNKNNTAKYQIPFVHRYSAFYLLSWLDHRKLLCIRVDQEPTDFKVGLKTFMWLSFSLSTLREKCITWAIS